jgi:methyl-accepting chemotaxis protein
LADGNGKEILDCLGDVSGAEQVRGMELISNSIVGMEKITQNTAASAEESSSASEEMAAQAEPLSTVADELNQIVHGSGTLMGA